jgi:hypothetical protein
VHRFPKCGGWWALFICPRCGGGAQRLRLLDGELVCRVCVKATGLIYRSQATVTAERHMITAPPRIARLNSDKPLRVHARPGRTFDGRVSLENSLRRSLIVARQAAIDEHDRWLKDK